jgi:hypothetical protein
MVRDALTIGVMVATQFAGYFWWVVAACLLVEGRSTPAAACWCVSVVFWRESERINREGSL